MKKGQEHNNRLWWMISAVVLLFVAAAVMPVAASYNQWNEGYFYNYTNITSANLVRFNDFPGADGRIHLTMYNNTGGMNAIHISDSPVNKSPYYYGQCTEKFGSSGGLTGTFYATDTGGRGYQDNIILLIGVYSPEITDRQNIQIDVNASGYNWTPHATLGEGPFRGEPVVNVTNITITSANYAYNSTTGGIDQPWKFSPLPDYPMYCKQSVGSGEAFNWTAVDLQMGIVSNKTYNHELTKNGTVTVNYSISRSGSYLSEDTMVAFNIYAYNRHPGASGGSDWNQTLWLNRVNKSGDAYIAPGSSSPSGWLVKPAL